jgi:hypothetical protein
MNEPDFLEDVNEDNDQETDITELEQLNEQLEEDIKGLWDNVISPYLEETNCGKEILTFMTPNKGFNEFRKFVLQNSEFCKNLERDMKLQKEMNNENKVNIENKVNKV